MPQRASLDPAVMEAIRRLGGLMSSHHPNPGVRPYSGPPQDERRWDRREDGSRKGQGFLGPLQGADPGTVMSEFSVGLPVNGVETEVPSMVPTLTRQELEYILNFAMPSEASPAGTHRLPQSIYRKAGKHAESRIAQGKPVFAGPGEARFPRYAPTGRTTR